MIMALGLLYCRAGVAGACPRVSLPGVTVEAMTYPLTAAQANLAELVAEARRSHRPVTISEHGKPVAALINVEDLADLEDRAALAAHLADKAAERGGISLEELDTALDRIDAESRW
jgi:prevent-host-death family protein